MSINQNSLFEKFEIIGDSIQSFISKYKNILGINSTVLITGETGTGKELIARWLHFNDPKKADKPFVKISIPNIYENIFESEVFGYEKGAFTGAITSKKGLIEVAEDGTIFFDEIENAAPSVQSKLLQLFEDRIYRKVGDTVFRKTGARFVVATNRNLLDDVKTGSFRADLYYRLAVLEIQIPALRERKEDILKLSNYFLDIFNKESGKNVKEVGEKELKVLSAYSWPGNIRELKNYIEKAIILSDSPTLDLSMIPENKPDSAKKDSFIFNYKEYIKDKETELIKKALANCSGNVNDAAVLIGMSTPFIYKKIKEYGITL